MHRSSSFLVLAAVLGCGGPAEVPAPVEPAAPIALPEPGATVPAEPHLPPAALPTAPRPSRTALAGGCSAGAPHTLRPARTLAGIAIAIGDDGGLVAYPTAPTTVALVPIDAEGAQRGEAVLLETPPIERVWAITRSGPDFLVSVAADCTDEPRVCLHVYRVPPSGAPIGAPTSVGLPFGGPLLRVLDPSEATATRGWLAGAFDRSRRGEGVLVRSLRVDVDGTPRVGDLDELGSDLPRGAELGDWHVAASELGLAAVFSATGDDPDWDGVGERAVVRRTYLGRAEDDFGARVVPGLEGTVLDLAFLGQELHVLVEGATGDRSVGRLGDDGALVSGLTPIAGDVLPPPFADRALVALETQRRAIVLVARDSLGRSLGGPVAIGGEVAELAWTGARFLVARGEGRAASVVAVTCRP